ncbi:MAG TPA: hypothetical protein VIM58_05790 [Candidatus Methylacidiphilales bacterium]
MDARSFFVVVVKLFGLWVVYHALSDLLTTLFVGAGIAIIPTLIQLLIGMLIICVAKPLARIVGL